jgi:hypothetical protein
LTTSFSDGYIVQHGTLFVQMYYAHNGLVPPDSAALVALRRYCSSQSFFNTAGH